MECILLASLYCFHINRCAAPIKNWPNERTFDKLTKMYAWLSAKYRETLAAALSSDCDNKHCRPTFPAKDLCQEEKFYESGCIENSAHI